MMIDMIKPDPGNQWSGKKLSVRLQQIKRQWINLGPQQQGLLDNLILSAEHLEEQLDAPSSETVENAAERELANIANAERFNRERFRDDTEFADWVQSRCRHTLTAPSATAPTINAAPQDAAPTRLLGAEKSAQSDQLRSAGAAPSSPDDKKGGMVAELRKRAYLIRHSADGAWKVSNSKVASDFDDACADRIEELERELAEDRAKYERLQGDLIAAWKHIDADSKMIDSLQSTPSAISAWKPINEHPSKTGWYGIRDAEDAKRAALWTGKFWAHQSVEPLKAWCEFPPTDIQGGSNG